MFFTIPFVFVFLLHFFLFGHMFSRVMVSFMLVNNFGIFKAFFYNVKSAGPPNLSITLHLENLGTVQALILTD